MDLLKNARRPLRAQFTRLLNELSELLTQAVPDRENVQVVVETLTKCYEKLEHLDQKIVEQQVTDQATATEQDFELQKIEEYERKFRTIKIKTEKLLERPSSPVGSDYTTTTNASHSNRNYRLPKIELKKFDGNLKEWLGFWSQFSKIHEDTDIPKSDKFQYLSQSMVAGSRAREVVEAYPQSAANYDKAIAALRNRFGREELLVEVYVRELLKLVINNINNSRDRLSVTKLYDKLETHLRALESLGVTSEKYAAMLFPLVESALNEDILRAWQRSSLSGQEAIRGDPDKSRLYFLMEFLSNEVQSEERIALARSGFQVSTSHKENEAYHKNRGVKKNTSREIEDMPTAMGLYSSQDTVCIFCEKTHDSLLCMKAQNWTMEEKKSKIQKAKACFVCLKPGHVSRTCRSPMKCVVCKKRHNVLMCPDLPATTGEKEASKDEVVQSATSSSVCSSDVVMKTLMLNLVGRNGQKRAVRAFFDCGSQRSYILKETAEDLGIKPSEKVTLNHTLFGGQKVTKQHNKYNVKLEHFNGRFSFPAVLLDDKQICALIPRVQKGPWMKTLKKNKIWLSDLGNNPSKIEVLIGLDIYDKLMTGRKVELANGLTATETKLGWTLSGAYASINRTEDNIALDVISMFVSDASISELWRLDAIGIQDPIEKQSIQEKDEAVRKHFLETVRRSESGRYSVRLPWIGEVREIPNNRNVAERRLASTTKKLLSLGKFQEYEDVLREWIRENIIEEVPEQECESPAYYLPHHPVFKPESSTTPIRPVFDASCKMNRNPSLNDCLEKGPNLTPLVPAILHRFRERAIGVVSDIRKAFQMIEMQAEDRDFLRFLWWEDPAQSKLKVLRHRRVVFGVNCSPFLLVSVLQYHFNQVEESQRPLAERLLHSFYVDNCITSVDSEEEAQLFRVEATTLLAEAGMELRQWEFGPTPKNEHDPSYEGTTSSVLGLKWNRITDSLSCELPSKEKLPELVSKRTVLSWVQRIFDPLGFLCPILILPKLILQKAWSSKVGWDQELPEETMLRFKKWCEELPFLENIQIPREVTGGKSLRQFWEIHTFCDASQDAYASVVFLRTCQNGKKSVQLVQAKSRIAPLKRGTIPRI